MLPPLSSLRIFRRQSMSRYRLSDFDYELPPELIAQAPAVSRVDSRLLHVDGQVLEDLAFRDFPRLVDRAISWCSTTRA